MARNRFEADSQRLNPAKSCMMARVGGTTKKGKPLQNMYLAMAGDRRWDLSVLDWGPLIPANLGLAEPDGTEPIPAGTLPWIRVSPKIEAWVASCRVSRRLGIVPKLARGDTTQYVAQPKGTLSAVSLRYDT